MRIDSIDFDPLIHSDLDALSAASLVFLVVFLGTETGLSGIPCSPPQWAHSWDPPPVSSVKPNQIQVFCLLPLLGLPRGTVSSKSTACIEESDVKTPPECC